MPTFRERVFVPVWWWLVAGVFVFSVFVAAAFSLGPWPALVLALAGAAVVAAVLVPYGSARIVVDDSGLTVGDSHLEWQWVAGVRHRDAAETRARLRTEADARAHLAVRPFLADSVEVTLDDPADPHPYWLVSSRRATELAAAIQQHLATQESPRA
ncbi:DUF3093 domain-containing protein [Mariniluteicoccus flavus]